MLLDYGARFDLMAVFEAVRGNESEKDEESTATMGFLIKLGVQTDDVVAWRKGTVPVHLMPGYGLCPRTPKHASQHHHFNAR
jgi:hypothetical protein